MRGFIERLIVGLLALALLPWQGLALAVPEPEMVCSRHGRECSCPDMCMREHAEIPTAMEGMACHREAAPPPDTEETESGPSWRTCGTVEEWAGTVTRQPSQLPVQIGLVMPNLFSASGLADSKLYTTRPVPPAEPPPC